MGCTWALVFVLVGLGAAILTPTWRHRVDEDPTGGYVVGGAFALVGIVMACFAIHQSLAVRTPETRVSIDEWPLKPGQPARIRIHQPGPVRLRSLSGRLVCEVRERDLRSPHATAHTSYRYRYPCQEQFFHSGEASIPAAGSFEATAELRVPEGALPSGPKDEHTLVRWRIEVWGRVRWWPDFMHPYEIEVVA